MRTSTRVVRRRWPAWPTRRRIALAMIVGLPLLAAACGGAGSSVAQLGATATQGNSSSNSAAASTPANGAVAFAACMRSHRLPNWPDPNRSGVFDKTKLTPQKLGASTSRIQAAQTACQHLLPGSGAPNLARVQQMRLQGLAFSRCVRNHGVQNFPDPGTDGRIPDPATVGIDQGSPVFEAANQACGKYRPPYMPSNNAYNAYTTTHG
jgi:hypothetical protein